ncbi:MAG: histidine kinase [Opitutaceae bacterium]|nr:histidine kinase [Opitutaceae bacterium]
MRAYSESSPFLHKLTVKWLIALGIWALVGLALSVEVYFNLKVSHMEVAFADVATAQYARALFWAFLAPFVLWLRVLVPVRTGGWVAGVAFHATVSMLVMLGYYLGRTVVLMLLDSRTLEGFWEMARSNFYGRNLIDAVYYWAVLGAGYSLEYYRRYKSEELKAAQLESRLVETELKALKQQLQPHFLFNTMNTISVLVREGRNDDAVTLLARLSSLLRLSLELGRAPEVTLRQELEFIERYVGIQKVRFADRLTVTTDFEPAALDARIPNLLLQPLVENAILHGIAPLTRAGTVSLAGRVENGCVRVEVRDDGCGFSPSLDPRSRSGGIGLSSTRERVMKRFGAAGEFFLESSPGRGTTIRIGFPFRT